MSVAKKLRASPSLLLLSGLWLVRPVT